MKIRWFPKIPVWGWVMIVVFGGCYADYKLGSMGVHLGLAKRMG